MRYARFLGLGALGAALFGCSSDAVPPPSVASGGMIGASGDAGAPNGAAGASAGSTAGGSTSGGGTGAGGSQAGATSSGGAGASGTGGVTTGGSGGATGGGGGGNGGSAAMGGSGGVPALEPCSEPSVSRLKVWEMQVVGGTQVPANGSPLRKYDGGYELYVEWTLTQGGAYGTANAPINNQGQYTNGADPTKNAIDISKGTGLTIEYASTGNTYMQIRTGTVPHGGDHFRADLPTTNGMLKTIELAYADFRRPGGTMPPGDDVLKDAFSFTFVGGGSTKLTLRQIRIPGFVPPCE